MKAATTSDVAGTRVVLHSPVIYLWWFFQIAMVPGLLVLPWLLFQLWRHTHDLRSVMFGVLGCGWILACVVYARSQTRRVVAERHGLTIIESRRVRRVPWREVRALTELGKSETSDAMRYRVELSDGTSVTFLGEPKAMKRLATLREEWSRSDATGAFLPQALSAP